MSEQFQLIDAKEQPVLSIRTRTPIADLPQAIGKAYMAIATYMQELGETPKDAPFTAYYNMDMDDLDVEMGFPVSKPLPAKGEIQKSVVPAGKQASCMFKGSYSLMESTYNALNEWITQQGFEPTGISYEYYYNSPCEVPEEELLTKIVFPLK